MENTKTREQIRMELYKEAYLLWLPQIRAFTNNIAKSEAEKAVKSFDDTFKQGNNG